MSGIKFLVDAKGEKTAVQIDLKKHGRLWETFYDNLLFEKRKSEPRASWTKVKARLNRTAKLDG